MQGSELHPLDRTEAGDESVGLSHGRKRTHAASLNRSLGTAGIGMIE